MEARKKALAAFYSGPVWQAHRDEANATMIDSDNVFLLRRARVGTRFTRSEAAQYETTSLVVAETFPLIGIHTAEFTTFFEGELEPVLLGAGASALASYVTEPSANTFPQLPVRTDTTVFIWFSSFDDEVAYARYRRTLERSLQERHELMNHTVS